jgi:hypothetical protein
MRCLYCDGKLPLYRKITHGQFCSTAHRKAYWQKQEQLAIERLHQTHNSLRAYRPPGPIENILGPALGPELAGELGTELGPGLGAGPGTELSPELRPAALDSVPELSGFATPEYGQRYSTQPTEIVADLFAFESNMRPIEPVLALTIINSKDTKDIDAAGLLPLFGLVRSSLEARNYGLWPCIVELSPCGLPASPSLPSISVVYGLAVPMAEMLRLGWTGQMAAPAAGFLLGALPSPRPLEVPLSRPSLPLSLAPLPQSPQHGAEEEVPDCNRMLPLPRFGISEIRIGSPVGAESAMVVVPAAVLAGLTVEGQRIDRTPRQRDLLRLAMPQIPLVHGTLMVERGVESLGGANRGAPSDSSLFAVSTPPVYPQLRMAEGRRYAVEFRANQMRSAAPEPTDCIVLPADVALPHHQAAVAVEAVPAVEEFVPESAGLVPLTFSKTPPAAKPAVTLVTKLVGIPQPLRTDAIRPSSKLEPIDAKPLIEEIMSEPPSTDLGSSGMALPEKAVPAKVHLWTHAAGFWKHAPRDLKLLMFAIPALLALAFHPSLPKVAVTAPPTTGELKRNITTAMTGQFATIRQAVYERAAVALDEDFRSGLDDWVSRGDATTEWSFDATGFVRPGPLALYRPSMGLTDYHMLFMGMIDQKAMSWVVRAEDFNNYYVIKLNVLKPGPQTTVGLTRYAVIDGKAQDRVDTIVPFEARPDMLYRVQMDIRDDSFALSMQGQMVDSWSEPRLRHGGIGFFTAKGEESRVRWVQVEHQYDMLGRLCAYLAPYEIPTTNGSW